MSRDRLVLAAREVLEKDGLEGLTLRAIARHAGVSHGAPLRHFPSLASLVTAVASEGFEQLYEYVDQALQAAGPRATAEKRVMAACRGYVRFALDNPGVFGLMFRGERLDLADLAYIGTGTRAFRQLVDLVADAQRHGWQPSVPAEELAGAVWSMVHGLATLWQHYALQATVPDADLERFQELFDSLLFPRRGKG